MTSFVHIKGDSAKDYSIVETSDGLNTSIPTSRAVAAAITDAGFTWVVKAADQSVTSNTTIAADDELTFDVKENKTYLIKFGFISGGAHDLKMLVSMPARATAQQAAGTVMSRVSGTNDNDTAGIVVLVGSDDNAHAAAVIDSKLGKGWAGEMFATFAAAGTVVLKWAQSTSSETPAIVYAGSFFAYKQID